MNRAKTGKIGELSSARYLRQNGYEIISANYRCRVGEIDIIAKDEKYICFVEVKTRDEKFKISPADAVDLSKRKKIIAAASLYLAVNRYELQPRFDIIEVIMSNDNVCKIKHIKNAFDGDGR